MKKPQAITLAFFMTVTAALATVLFPFQSWDKLLENCPDILIVKCGKVSPPPPGHIRFGAGRDYKIEVVSVLKGTNQPGPAEITSVVNLRDGEQYLVFGAVQNGYILAFEEYRVIPLGPSFSTNMLSGKTLDEQIQFLLKLRLDEVNRQLDAMQKEKQRLEEGLKK